MRLRSLLAVGLLLLPLPVAAQVLGPVSVQLGAPSPTSTQVSNTTTNTAVASYTIPPGYISSGRAHLKLLGNLSTLNATPGTFTIQAAVCGTTVTAVNAATLDSGLATAPFSFDVWLSPYGLGGGAQAMYFFSDWRDAATATTETIIKKVQRITACDTTAQLSITVNFQFGTASIGNGIQVESSVFATGQ